MEKMARKGSSYIDMEQLVYSQKDDRFELHGHPLHDGDRLEVRIFGFWVPGVLAHDQSGWYLVTHEQVEVRLRAGLMGRLPRVSPPSSSSPDSSSTE